MTTDLDGSTMRPRIPWRRKLVYFSVVIGMLAVLAELGLRLIDPEIFRFVYAARQLHYYAGWNFVDLRPNQCQELRLRRTDGSDYLHFTVTTDALGGRVCGSRRNEGAAKLIHCIGDSFTMGWGVADQQSYPAVLSEKLGSSAQVLNLGVDGFGLMAAAEKSRRVAATRRPDVLLYLFCENDFSDDVLTQRTQARSSLVQTGYQAFDVLRRNSYLANSPFAIRWAMLYRKARMAAGSATPAANTASNEQERTDIEKRLPDVAPADNLTTAALASLSERCRGDGVRLVVVVIDGSSESLGLMRFCREKEIELALCPLTAAAYRIPDDGHLNVAGNRALAEFLAREVFAK
jgi:lysophospholipase L1-like esterase